MVVVNTVMSVLFSSSPVSFLFPQGSVQQECAGRLESVLLQCHIPWEAKPAQLSCIFRYSSPHFHAGLQNVSKLNLLKNRHSHTAFIAAINQDLMAGALNH